MPVEFQVFAHPAGDSYERILSAVKAANGLQSYFKILVVPETRVLSGSDATRSYDELDASFSKLTPEPKGLVFMEEKPEEPRLVDERLPKRVYSTCAVWRGAGSPPLELYLLYQIAAAALSLSTRLDEDVNYEMTHDKPIGCLWDWWSNDSERSLAMISARICDACRTALRLHGGLGDAPIEATQQILEYIRRRMMGENPGIARRVFIAHGHDPAWETLVEFLREWELEVDFFDRTATAGTLTTDRWRQMLDGARFAFALLTPDDVLQSGDKQARQNVIHEIGLCHAHLGLHSTAILRDTTTVVPTNLDAVGRIDFTTGKLREKKDEIRALLVERGLL